MNGNAKPRSPCERKLTNSFFSIKNEDNKLLHIISKIKKKKSRCCDHVINK